MRAEALQHPAFLAVYKGWRQGAADGAGGRMRELIRSNDIVLMGFAESLLQGAEIPVLVADIHMSLLEGSIGAFARRLLVPDDHATEARHLLEDAGLAHELRDA